MSQETNFENVVLKGLTSNSRFFNRVFHILKEDYFTESRKDIFKILKKTYQQYHNVPSLTDIEIQIKNQQNQENRDKIQESLENIKLVDTPTIQENFENETLSFVKDKLYLKALEVGSEGLLTKSDTLKKKAEQILDERAKLNLSSDLGIELFDASMQDYYSLELTGIKPTHTSLARRLGSGFLPGTLSAVLAPAGVGKSLFMTDFASSLVKASKNVLFVSLEMSSQEVIKRVHANVLEMMTSELIPGRFNKKLFQNQLNDLKKLNPGKFYAKDYPAGSFSASQLEALVESYKNELGIEFDLIMLDYLGIMKSDLLSPNAGLYSYIKSIGEEVRASAKRLNVPIVSCSQLNRGAYNNVDADNSTISDSIGTIMTLDFALFLLQTEEMKSKGEMIFKITKNRFSGITESFPMRVNYSLMRFEDPEGESIISASEAKTDTGFKLDEFTVKENIKKTDELFKEIERQDKIDLSKNGTKPAYSSNSEIDDVLAALL